MNLTSGPGFSPESRQAYSSPKRAKESKMKKATMSGGKRTAMFGSRPKSGGAMEMSAPKPQKVVSNAKPAWGPNKKWGSHHGPSGAMMSLGDNKPLY